MRRNGKKNGRYHSILLDLLQVMDGDLAPGKCIWYLIAHRWKRVIPNLLENKDTHRGIIMMPKETGKISAVKIKSVSQGHRTLWFHLCGDRSSRANKKAMQEKAIEYGEAIVSSSLKRGVCTMTYNSCYMLSLGYGTVETSLSMEECKEIQKPPGNAILQKMGKTGKLQEMWSLE
jgi:hypothetical protein